jgi:sulfate transport system substrate-binding protein
VRKGNPKGIKDWADLIKPGVSVITANPKTSGGARWSYLAAYGYALKLPGGSDASAKEYVQKLFKNVPVLDSGARGSTVTFTERGIGDVLLSWENEAYLGLKEFGADKFEIITPSISILAEPPLSVVDKVVDKRGTRKVAEAYLNYLTPTRHKTLSVKISIVRSVKKRRKNMPGNSRKSSLFNIDDTFSGWTVAQKTHFADGGVFDQIYQPNKK